ncbi:MAG: hypothetical protein ACFFFH_18900, partial [Candidatus Thorarchaeota archaeon]
MKIKYKYLNKKIFWSSTYHNDKSGKDKMQDELDLNGSSTKNNAIRIIVSALAILSGFAGFEHGFFEMLQGNVAPEGFVISAIGPNQRFWSLGQEPAFTIIPN